MFAVSLHMALAPQSDQGAFFLSPMSNTQSKSSVSSEGPTSFAVSIKCLWRFASVSLGLVTGVDLATIGIGYALRH
jgi:hypothetical protein